MTDKPSVKSAAWQHYVDYWEGLADPPHPDTRWDVMKWLLEKGDFQDAYGLMREAHIDAFMQGFALRLTGE